MQTPVVRFGLPLRESLLLLRIGTAGLFMVHAVVRIANGSIAQFAHFMGEAGFPLPLLWVWAITLVELVCGSLMVLGWCARWMALGLFAIAFGGIVIIHARNGWFVGEHGTGGSEYSVCLILCLVVIAAADRAGIHSPEGKREG
jgi:putative oxidoreductase